MIVRANTYMKDVFDLSTMTNALHMNNFYKKIFQFLSVIKIMKNLLLRCLKSKSHQLQRYQKIFFAKSKESHYNLRRQSDLRKPLLRTVYRGSDIAVLNSRSENGY